MRILIGGSPSTGSSLFRQILNRHSQVFCGPETYLFIYPRLYTHWKATKQALYRKGPFHTLKSPGVFLQNGVKLLNSEFGIAGHRQLRSLVDVSHTFPEFVDAFFQISLKHSRKQYWAEKSPANALCFGLFLEAFRDARVVHMIRDPYETLASLVSRGQDVFTAASLYLLHTASALSHRGHDGYLTVRYEDLVSNPAQTMQGFLDALGLPFEETILSAGNPEMTEPSRMEGWRFDETQKVQPKVKSRFPQVDSTTQAQIRYALSHVHIADAFVSKYGLKFKSFDQVLPALGYKAAGIGKAETEQALQHQIRKGKLHFLSRCLRNRHWEQVLHPPTVIR